VFDLAGSSSQVMSGVCDREKLSWEIPLTYSRKKVAQNSVRFIYSVGKKK